MIKKRRSATNRRHCVSREVTTEQGEIQSEGITASEILKDRPPVRGDVVKSVREQKTGGRYISSNRNLSKRAGG